MNGVDSLRVTLVQMEITWEDREANLRYLDQLFSETESTDLIILPEMFTTGFSVNTESLAEPPDGETTKWMKTQASKLNSAIIGTIIIKENNQIFNRCLFVMPDGAVQIYDKRHLYTMGEEHNKFTAGTKKLIVEYKGWKICPLICYDLRFPVWSRNIENYDLLIYMANWPSPRHHVWKNLLVARAIENQSYCIGINRVGTDGAGLSYLGESTMCDAKGNASFLSQAEEVKSFELSKTDLINFRNKFPLLVDQDKFEIIP